MAYRHFKKQLITLNLSKMKSKTGIDWKNHRSDERKEIWPQQIIVAGIPLIIAAVAIFYAIMQLISKF